MVKRASGERQLVTEINIENKFHFVALFVQHDYSFFTVQQEKPRGFIQSDPNDPELGMDRGTLDFVRGI